MPMAIASATKMLTALVVRDHADLADVVSVSARAASTPGGKLSLTAGQQVTVEDLLWGMLLNSSNDAAVALAEHVGGTEERFVQMMEASADRLGARATSLVSSHGLDAPGHHSTARDLATLAAHLLDDPLLAEIVAAPTAEIIVAGDPVTLENTNLLLETYPGAVGVKTGFTSDAGNVLVAAAERRGRRLIAVALGSQDHFADAAALLDTGFAVIGREVLLKRGLVVGVVFLDGSGTSNVVASRRLTGLRPQGGVRIGLEPHPLSGPVDRGDVVGTVLVTAGGRTVGSVPALADTSLRPPAPTWLNGVLARLIAVGASIIPGDDI